MTRDLMDERRAALEDEFFHKQDQKKLEQMKEQLSRQATRDELQRASGMTDVAVLDKLVALGLNAKTVAALSLVPLVAVAWADGEIQDAERDAILRGAEGKGVTTDTPGYQLLSTWLSHPPTAGLFDAWLGYIEALLTQLTDEQLGLLKKQVVEFSNLVAGAAGGVLGIGKVSGSEAKVLASIDSAFTR